MTNIDLRAELENTIMESPLGVSGVDKTLPTLEQLLKELMREEFWDKKKCKRRLSEEQMIRAWATYRQDLRELRERMRQRQQAWDDLLTWLAMFLIEHYADLARTSATYEAEYQLAFDMSWANLTPEQALACRDDWQAWVVEWLRDALRDEDLDAGLTAAGGSQGGDDGDGDLTPAPQPARGPRPDSAPEIEF